jgi:hypothetical protein
MPPWLRGVEEDFEELLELAAAHVEAVVSRYRGRAKLWVCAARINTGEALRLSLEQRLHLVVRAFEVIHQLDPATPSVIRLDQPWGEYMRKATVELSPMQIADGLIRAGLPLSALALEMNVGYEQGGTLVRDRIELSRLLDHWACLGLPLHVRLVVPSSAGRDRHATGPARCEATPLYHWTVERQAEWVDRSLPLLLTKPVVHSITWGQLSDQGPHEFPHGGLQAADGRWKPVMARLAELREQHL